MSSNERLTLFPIKITVAEERVTIITKYEPHSKIPGAIPIPISILLNKEKPKSDLLQTLNGNPEIE